MDALVRPRLTGSAGARETEAELRRRFEALGYGVRELPFSFSTVPGRYGLPVAGVALLAAAIASGWLLAGGRPAASLAALGAALAAAVLPYLALGPALRHLPWGRVETANLLFTRQDPHWIVMAHRDTKSQPVPTLVRTAALTLALLAWTALVVLSVMALDMSPGVAGAAVPWIGAAVLAAAATVLAVSVTDNRSPGALDNGTGLAALLALATRVPPDVGFLVTDGEELGLAGARAAVVQLPRMAGIINLDGLDDEGPIRIAESRTGRWGSAGAMAATLLDDARLLGLEAVRRRLPPFVLVDHEPLAAAGRPALTVLKGSWRSLLRVHRPTDTVERLSGAGAAEVTALVAMALGGLAGRGRDTLRAREPSGHSPAS